MAALVRPRNGPLLRQEKDEASPLNCLSAELQDAFILHLPGFEGFFVLQASSSPALVSQLNPPCVASPRGAK
jgi:hypothetical protein